MAQTSLLENIDEGKAPVFPSAVTLRDGRPATTSLAIAEHFGKRHPHVMRDIRNLCAELPEEVRGSNFGLTSRTIAGPNNSERQEEFFTVFFDGFILLVMGYTGKKALQVKLMYINAFNAMKEKLDKLAAEERARLAGDVKALPDPMTTVTPSTPASRKALEKLVKVWAVQGGIIVSQCWTMLNSAFNLQSITELPEEWIPDAIAWVQEKIDGLQKTLPPARLPVSKRCAPTPASPIDEAAILQLIKDIQEAHEQVETILDPLSTRAVRLSTTLALEIQKRGALSPSIGPLFHNGLDDLLFHSTFKATRQAMIAPARLLDEYSNPGYTLLSIARQLNAKG